MTRLGNQKMVCGLGNLANLPDLRVNLKPYPEGESHWLNSWKTYF